MHMVMVMMNFLRSINSGSVYWRRAVVHSHAWAGNPFFVWERRERRTPRPKRLDHPFTMDIHKGCDGSSFGSASLPGTAYQKRVNGLVTLDKSGVPGKPFRKLFALHPFSLQMVIRIRTDTILMLRSSLELTVILHLPDTIISRYLSITITFFKVLWK